MAWNCLPKVSLTTGCCLQACSQDFQKGGSWDLVAAGGGYGRRRGSVEAWKLRKPKNGYDDNFTS